MQRPRRQVSKTVTVPAPIGGWNVKDPLSMMKPTDAVILDNWFCLPTELRIRKGYSEWATGFTGTAESVFDWCGPTTTKLFTAVVNSGSCSIYDITTKGSVSPAVVTGLTSARFNHVQFSTSGGSFLVAVNGSDLMREYNGTTWTTPTVNGITTDKFIDVTAHKRRLFFVEKNSMNLWYLPTDSIAGNASKFDLGPIFTYGGKIARIETWSLDAGQGMDDYLVIITSQGEIAIYSGIDPASATDWQLNGVYYVGAPVGFRNTCKYGGDVLLLNKDGVIPLSKALMSSRVSTRMVLTDKIQSQIAEDTTSYAGQFGWEIILFPPQNMLLVNIPINSTESYQYVMNTISGAWSRWTNIPAKCWYFSGEELFFGDGGKVFKMWDGQNDNGTIIVTDLLPAYSAFGNSSQSKRWTMAKVSMGHDADFSFSANLTTDFDKNNAPAFPYNVINENVSRWDVAKWDANKWTGGISPYSQWKFAGGVGYYGSFRIRTASKESDIRYYATGYVYEVGGVL
jgi:hypothetical protein